MRLLAVIGFMICAVPAMAKDCSIQHYDFVFGADTQTTMTVKSGAMCQSTITAGSSITSSVIAQPAANGTAQVNDPHHWAYKSKPGFRGTDAFVVQVTGTSHGKRSARTTTGDTKINVGVNVVP